MREGTTAAAVALAMCLSIALVIDLGEPSRNDRHVPTSVASVLREAQDLAEQMETQTAAGMPGVALAIERAAPDKQRHGASVTVARARAQFELGDAPGALNSTREGLRQCEKSTDSPSAERSRGPCTAFEKAQLGWLETILSAVVDAGVVDVRNDPSRASAAVRQLVQPTKLQIPSGGDASAARSD